MSIHKPNSVHIHGDEHQLNSESAKKRLVDQVIGEDKIKQNSNPDLLQNSPADVKLEIFPSADVLEGLNPGKEVHECSLGLTFFYDGGTNYKRSADSMWPLVTSVINCNPSNRTQLGIGSLPHLTLVENNQRVA